jgi:hypothetical protein
VKVTTEELLSEAADMVNDVKGDIAPNEGHSTDSFDALIARLEIIKQTVVTAKWVEYRL